MKESSVARVTVALDPEDVELLDRLAALEGKNRSYELRGLLREARPVLRATVEAFEAALSRRDELDALARSGLISDLQALAQESEAMSRQFLGSMSRLEGAAAASEAADPRPSNHGGHTPTPTPNPTPDESES